MKKITYETTDLVSFEPHEWKQISLDPVVYEALKDETIFKFHDYQKSDDEKMQSFHRLVFHKGEQIEVSINGNKFKLNLDSREFRVGEKIDFDLDV